MAITEHAADGDRFDDGTDSHRESTAARPNTTGPQSKNKGGGPQTRKGKENSSKNSTKAGVFSKSPLVRGERLEEWEERLQGLRDSLRPSGYLEEMLVYEMALNRQQKDRLDRSMNATVQHQLETAAAFDHIPIVAELLAGHDDDSAAFWNDPAAARPILDALTEGEEEAAFSGYEASAFYYALTIACDIDRSTTAGFPRTPFNNWTMEEVRKALEVVVATCGLDSNCVIITTQLEVDRAELKQTLKEQQDLRDVRLNMAQALLPPPAELEKSMRYGTYLDKQFDRLMHRFEVAQRARGGALPPPIRLDIQES